MNKNLIWAITTFLIVAMVCGTVLWINHNSWTLRFEMDNNTKEAIESIEYPIINEASCREAGIQIPVTKNCSWDHTGRTC